MAIAFEKLAWPLRRDRSRCLHHARRDRSHRIP
jgi:hypothetical protein